MLLACFGSERFTLFELRNALCWLLGTSVQEIGPVVQDGASFLAKVGEIRVQSTRSILRIRSDHAPIFTKKRFHCAVCIFLDQAMSSFSMRYDHIKAFISRFRKGQSPAFHQLSLMNESSQFRSWVGYTTSTEERPERFNS
jgi:hypothetical protein